MRLGTSIQLEDDLYSMLFTSCIAADYVVAAEHRRKVEDQDLQEIYQITKSKMEKKICDKELKPSDFAYAHNHLPGTEEVTGYLP